MKDFLHCGTKFPARETFLLSPLQLSSDPIHQNEPNSSLYQEKTTQQAAIEMSPIEERDMGDDQNSTWIVSGADMNETNFGVSDWSLTSNMSDWSPAKCRTSLKILITLITLT